MTGWVPPGPALLFCPADRPDRYAKAAARADAVILDLEDAVAASDRVAAREALVRSAVDPSATIVRVNPWGSADYRLDIKAMRKTRYRCVMLAKAESAESVTETARHTGCAVLALLETPLGIVRAAEIAAAEGVAGLMWGAEDLIAAMGGRTSRFAAGGYRDVPRQARGTVALTAAAFGRWSVDAVHLDIGDSDGLRAEAEDAAALGFAATACIHPSQVPVVRAAYAPTPEEIAWARKVLAAATAHAGVFELDGQMIDSPLLRQAEATLRRIR